MITGIAVIVEKMKINIFVIMITMKIDLYIKSDNNHRYLLSLNIFHVWLLKQIEYHVVKAHFTVERVIGEAYDESCLFGWIIRYPI